VTHLDLFSLLAAHALRVVSHEDPENHQEHAHGKEEWSDLIVVDGEHAGEYDDRNAYVEHIHVARSANLKLCELKIRFGARSHLFTPTRGGCERTRRTHTVQAGECTGTLDIDHSVLVSPSRSRVGA